MKRIIFSLAILAMGMKLQAQTPISCYPLNQAKDINIDTHLIIEFDSEVKAGLQDLPRDSSRIPLPSIHQCPIYKGGR